MGFYLFELQKVYKKHCSILKYPCKAVAIQNNAVNNEYLVITPLEVGGLLAFGMQQRVVSFLAVLLTYVLFAVILTSVVFVLTIVLLY